ncbi:MAG TPA: M50 family metallopeptidase [Chloroflexia bacterium]
MNVARSAGKQPNSRGQINRRSLVQLRLFSVTGVALLVLLASAVGASRAVSLHTGEPMSTTLPDMLGRMWDSTVEVFGGMFVFFIAIMLLIWLETLVHEVGHLVAGWLVGFRFVMVTVGRLKLRATDGGLRLALTDKTDVQSGSALMVPTTLHNLRARWLAMTLGGMAGNLLLGAFFFGWLVLDPGGLWGYLPLSTGLSFVLGLMNLLPLKVNGYNSDGAHLQVLLGGGARAERFCYLTMITGASRLGQRPRDWDRAWVEGILQPADGTLDEVLANHVAFYWAMDVGQLQWADTYMSRTINLIDSVPPQLQPALYADAAFFRAYCFKDVAWARYFLGKVGTDTVRRFRHMHLRARSAVLAVEGKAEEAREVAREGLRESGSQTLKGPGWELDYEWLTSLAAS